MLPSKKRQNNPYSWQTGDTSTFSQQANNLSQFGGQGLDTSVINTQKNIADAQKKAGETGKNVGAGAAEVAKGAEIEPGIAQAATAANPQIQPYKTTKEAPTAPDPTIENKKFNSDATDQDIEDKIKEYVKKTYPNGTPADYSKFFADIIAARNRGD